jgi:oxygen-independent coproporphyrinogen III oxidase
VTAVYVHVPFCRGRCPYCDFASNDLAAPPIAAYLEALSREWAWRRSREPLGPAPETIYVGGGTPSILDAARAAEILELLGPAAGAEVTIEANPGDVDESWYAALAGAGVTRFSIGAQSMDPGRLAWLGRRHGVGDVGRAIAAARGAGDVSVSADLIYGTPGLTPERAAEEARRLAALGVDHVSAYELTVAAGTPLGRRAATEPLGLPDEAALVEAWDAIGEALLAFGLERYEVSSFAKAGRRCRHNERYWRGEAYAGLGAGAHGHVVGDGRRLRYANSARLDAYLDAASEGRFPANGGGVGEGASDDPVSAEGAAVELVALGLRWTDGVDLDALAALLPSETGRIARFAAALEAEGNARRLGGRLVPTRDGMLFADGLAARF